MNKLLPSVFLALLLSACASDPAPSEQLRLTAAALQQARAIGATDEIAELALAEAKLSEARLAMAEGDHRQARLLAEQAELDARLAEARVLSQKSSAQLAELRRSIERVREKLGKVQ
ncbi:DUF4398 domain-containing protein [Pseudomonas oligotrophica]|uniref:DUF4398 domain-containing protein n=1 Tax=Pseudomonas oligotrophica TaxID=2912055 RepID=UPI001F393834|nr:DUF4398 domain-containing protein [Pseudomonas oligotrophica]MCF7202737.1 DUF4398 domain-containing protein [Pseudomonas oligotrophica]